jgi:hypothetical protein
MAANRISGFYDSAKDLVQESQPAPEKGFAAIPTSAIPGLNDRWSEIQQIYGIAWLMAQAETELPSQE